MHIESILAHAGCDPDQDQDDATPPIHLTTTFRRDSQGNWPSGHKYARISNPTRARLERVLTDLEPASQALAFSSGMAAAAALLQSLDAGATVMLARDVYFGVRVLASDMAERGHIQLHTFDAHLGLQSGDMAALAAAHLVWIETPSNPLLQITDIEGLANACHTHNPDARLVVDGTWTTPFIQQPLSLGADVVFHSLTKYMAGHSDVLGGALLFRREDDLYARVRRTQETGGAVLDPFSCWLTLRGLRTLAVRLRVQQESALAVARFLEGHARVVRVHYPGLTSHPGHEVAAHQMRGYGAMCSFQTGRSGAETLALVGRAQVFIQATSLGGTESLIEHRRSAEGEASHTPEDLVRLSMGLEHIDDLVRDLARMLNY